jgi:hypothetical protein
MWNNFDF